MPRQKHVQKGERMCSSMRLCKEAKNYEGVETSRPDIREVAGLGGG